MADFAEWDFPEVRRGRRGFTLLELLVAMALVAIVAGMTLSILSATTSAWKAHKARIAAFSEARVAFETLTLRLSQATLNTYWDYDNRGRPTRYLRHSELHFLLGRATDLLPGIPDTSTDAVFFVAPLGVHEDPAYRPLIKMLTACGFWVQFGGEPGRPAFLKDKIPERFRYRLHQFIQPGERLQIYPVGPERDWFQSAILDWSFPIAENVIGLILRAKYPEDGGDVSTYSYDSRSFPNPNAPPATLHQLPPSISATLVIIDEDSAKRLAEKYGNAPPPILPGVGAFTDPDNYERDIQDWEALLRNFVPKIDYRILNANIALRGAKWSSK